VIQTTIEGCVSTVAQATGVTSPTLDAALDEFGRAIEQENASGILPERVDSLISNVCITARLGIQDLPEPLRKLYADAKQRQVHAAETGEAPLKYLASVLIRTCDEAAGIG
jgi:hypothetical protein